MGDRGNEDENGSVAGWFCSWVMEMIIQNTRSDVKQREVHTISGRTDFVPIIDLRDL